VGDTLVVPPRIHRRDVLKVVAAGLLGGLGAGRATVLAAAVFDVGWRYCQKCRVLRSVLGRRARPLRQRG
jgi:hypothetical protein